MKTNIAMRPIIVPVILCVLVLWGGSNVAAETGDYLFSFGERAFFNGGGCMDVTTEGKVYVLDGTTCRVIIHDKDGNFLGSFGERGDGQTDQARDSGGRRW